MLRSRLLLLLVLLPSLMAGCLGDAERGNPLDPRSDNFADAGAVAGQVTQAAPPFAPLAGAEVRLVPGPFVTTTDAAGRYRFEPVPTGTYEVAASAEDFAPTTDTVAVPLGGLRQKTLRLGGMPRFVAVDLRTVHVSRWWPPDDRFTLEVTVTADDPDGAADVDRVWLEVPALAFADTLRPAQQAGVFFTALDAAALPGGRLHALQGRDLHLVARDAARHTQRTTRAFARIIDYTPLTRAPQGSEVVDTPTPLLEWEPADLPFAFTYRVDVVRVDADVQTTVLQRDGLPATQTTFRVPAPLPQASYYWTVWVVDAFGNRSRSREAGFVVP